MCIVRISADAVKMIKFKYCYMCPTDVYNMG